jgi:hypothetical protein
MVLRPTNSIKVFRGFPWLRANDELVPKFHVALHASHAALPMVTLKISPYTNVTLTFDFGLDHPVHGGYGWGSPTPRRKKVICQTKKLKSGHGPHWVPGTKTNWPTDRRSQYNLKLNLRHCTANYKPSHQRGRPTSTNTQLSKNNQREKGKNWSRVQDGCLTPRRTGRPTVGRNITLTLTLTISVSQSWVLVYSGVYCCDL